MQRMTSREGSSNARAGFKVFGSERKAITSLPPARPGAPSAIIRSAAACGARPCTAELAHEIAMIRTRHFCDSRILRMYQLLAEIYWFLQRHRFVKFLQSIGGGIENHEQGNQQKRGQEHPPVGREN